MEEKVNFNDQLLKLMTALVIELKEIKQLLIDLSENYGKNAKRLRVAADNISIA